MVSLKIGNNILHEIDLVIFDKDGTLIELNPYWVKVTYMRAETIADSFNLNEGNVQTLASVMGVNTTTNRLKECGPVGVKKREVVMKAAVDYLLALGYNNSYNQCAAAFDEVDRKSLDIFDKLVYAIPGTERVLKELHENGCKIAIATSDRTARARLAMKHLNFLPYIDIIVGADCIVSPKPDPETVSFILEKLNCDHSHTIVVGDTDVDIELGIRSGVKASIGVFSGTAPRDVLIQKTPYVINNIGLIKVRK
jgi:phosphoglycolate phosphatase